MRKQDESLLSEREMEIMHLVATGATNLQIARELVISVNTVKVHLRNVFDKLGVQSRTEATLYVIRQGWIAVEGAAAVAEGEGEPAEAPAATQLPIVSWEPAPSVPLSWGRRLYFIAATALVVAVAFLPQVASGEAGGGAAANPLVDRDVAPVSAAADSRLAVSRWTGLARLPTSRARLAVVAYEGKLYAIGGEGPEGVTGALEVYDPQTDRWSAKKSRPTPAANVAAVALDGRIYVPGGYLSDGQVTTIVEVYDVERDEWRETTPLPEPLCAYAITAVDGMLYLFGGWDGQRYRDVAYAYDPASEEWSAREPLPGARAFAGAGAVDGKVYVIGGYDGQNELAANDEYDPAGDSWRPRSPMPQGRAGLSVTALGSSLYIIGGGWHSYLAANERYDPHTDTWAGMETPIVAEWRNLGTAAIDKDIYAVGGWSAGYLDVNEKYQAIYTIFLQLQPF
jgi:DNA-binding CsgD family transcriptional regulator/N-acetylneuraminic acid mutarotase